MQNINFIVVLIEGLLSILSPCILPIIPVYISILSNSSNDTNENTSIIKNNLLVNTLAFTFGICLTFFLLAFSINTISSAFNIDNNLISLVGGIIIIFMGLFYLDILQLNLLNRSKKINIKVKRITPFTSLLLGFTFSFGWTPCIGPMLSSVLIMASNESEKLYSYLLILGYSLGFIIPFILISIFYKKLTSSLNFMKNNMLIIKKIGGVLLIISGIFMAYNGYSAISNLNTNKNEVVQEEVIQESENNNKEDSEEDQLKALDFEFKDQYGISHSLEQYKGKTIFLNIWATWCPPCREEMPYIEEIYKEYGLNKDEVIILGLASPNFSREGDENHISSFLKENNYTFPTLFDTNAELINGYGIASFPSTLVIDKEGFIQQYVPGGMTKETMKYLIDSVKNK